MPGQSPDPAHLAWFGAKKGCGRNTLSHTQKKRRKGYLNNNLRDACGQEQNINFSPPSKVPDNRTPSLYLVLIKVVMKCSGPRRSAFSLCDVQFTLPATDTTKAVSTVGIGMVKLAQKKGVSTTLSHT